MVGLASHLAVVELPQLLNHNVVPLLYTNCPSSTSRAGRISTVIRPVASKHQQPAAFMPAPPAGMPEQRKVSLGLACTLAAILVPSLVPLVLSNLIPVFVTAFAPFLLPTVI